MSSKRKNRPTKLSKTGEYENGSGINNSDNYLNHNKYIDEEEDNDDISSDNGDDSDVDVEDNKFGHTIKREIKSLDMTSSDSEQEFDDNESGLMNNYSIDNSGNIFGNNLMISNKFSKRSMDDVLKKLTSKMPKCEDDKKIRF
jgi:hypothetical protein